MTADERRDLVESLEKEKGRRSRLLKKLGISESTYYLWRSQYFENGPKGLEKVLPKPKGGWNRMTQREKDEILQAAKDFPEKSSRELAIYLTDKGDFAVSEASVFRFLKKLGLIKSRPKDEKPAAKEYRHKTSRPNELWQIDGTQFWVPNWGYYKWIPVLDDFSRRIVAARLQEQESGAHVTDVVEEALDCIGSDELPDDRKPTLLSDNGSAFKSDILAKRLKARGITKIFGAPYHPQTQGKVERLNRRIKEKVNLLIYETPLALEKALDEAVVNYNNTPHESLKNVSPVEMYEGRQEEILARREAKKQWTLEMRRTANMALAA